MSLGNSSSSGFALATCQMGDLLAMAANGISPSQSYHSAILWRGKLKPREVRSEAHTTLERELDLVSFQGSEVPARCLSPAWRAVTYLQGCKPSEGLQGLQGLLGLSKDGLWLLGDRLQRKRPGTVNLAAPPACGRIWRLDQGCGSLWEKGPKARDSRSHAGLEGGARLMTREGSREATAAI